MLASVSRRGKKTRVTKLVSYVGAWRAAEGDGRGREGRRRREKRAMTQEGRKGRESE